MSDSQTLRIITELEGLAARVVKEITLDITSNFIETTPVDTGWAKANWIPKIGSPSTPSLVVGANAQRAATKGREADQQSGVTSVATSYTLAQGAVFISNNVPYIGKLNNGSSLQAPAGFIQDGIEKAVLKFRPSK